MKSFLRAYPNPLQSDSPLTVEGVAKGSPVNVFNLAGDCVKSNVAVAETVTLTLSVPSGIYVVSNGNKAVKIIVGNYF